MDKVVKDYIKIEYRDGSNLYILATQLDALQKYSGADTAKTPKLNKLGNQEWNRTKSKVKGAVKNIAKELVKLYAVRQEKEGYVCGPDTVWQREFEEMFPYEETEDQLNAIEDTKRDMESTKIMDRLVCGDVGYGKTEVALRAAFKEVQESRQVVYLVPTTILAPAGLQHIYPENEGVPGASGSSLPFPNFCPAEKDHPGSEKGPGGHCDRYPQSAFQGCGVPESGAFDH